MNNNFITYHQVVIGFIIATPFVIYYNIKEFKKMDHFTDLFEMDRIYFLGGLIFFIQTWILIIIIFFRSK